MLEMNIHGQCGDADVRCPCMKDGKCSKYFPKKSAASTSDGERMYPEYRSRSPASCGQTATITCGGWSFSLDNSVVVPYSPQLTLELGCHINMHVVTSTNAIKYVLKYITKGPDSAMISVVRCAAGPGSAQAALVPAAPLGKSAASSTGGPAAVGGGSYGGAAGAAREPIHEVQAFQDARIIGEAEAVTRASTSFGGTHPS